MFSLTGCPSSSPSSFDRIDLTDLGTEPATVPETSQPAATTADSASVEGRVKAGKKHLLDLEKDTFKFGLIKLTDCVPTVIAKGKDFFEEEGRQVDVEAQPNWKPLDPDLEDYRCQALHETREREYHTPYGYWS